MQKPCWRFPPQGFFYGWLFTVGRRDSLACGPGKLAPTHEVHMDMVNSLPAHFVTVHHHTVAILGKPLLLSKLRGGVLQAAYEG